jgi:regulator of RNase E activity RraA
VSVCRIHPNPPPAHAGTLEALSRLPTTVLSDQLDRLGGAGGLLPVGDLGTGIVAGRALTVRTRPGDNLVVHKAADIAARGDFIVVDAGGATDRAIVGELWCRHAASRGVAAVAVDGAARDAAALRTLAFPVFARGVCSQGPYKEGPGEIGGTIALGGTTVAAGDYVVGDADGVVVVPRERAAAVVASAERRLAQEAQMLAAIAAGSLDRSWLDALQVEEVG